MTNSIGKITHMPTMDAQALRDEPEGLAALRRTLGGVDELRPVPGASRPDMYRPRDRLSSPPAEEAEASKPVPA